MYSTVDQENFVSGDFYILNFHEFYLHHLAKCRKIFNSVSLELGAHAREGGCAVLELTASIA